MKKKELVYREILYKSMEMKKNFQTQLELSRELGLSLSTINSAVRQLARFGGIEILKQGFRLMDAEKIATFWASARSVQKDITYATRANMQVSEIEKNMPSGAIYTAYSGFKFQKNNTPADYSEVYVYADNETLLEIKARFPEAKGPANLIVLKSDDRLGKISKNSIAPIAQIYVDLWNLKEWYAKEFRNELEKQIGWQ